MTKRLEEMHDQMAKDESELRDSHRKQVCKEIQLLIKRCETRVAEKNVPLPLSFSRPYKSLS